VRIVAGRYGGRRLAHPPRRGVRPTADRVREALFSILGDAVAGRPFVDLCAGTGAVGLEALSRGAEPVVLVERARGALAVLRRNLELLGVLEDPAIRVSGEDVGRWLRGPEPREVGPAGVVFLDPPWDEDRRLAGWLALLPGCGLLDGDSLVIVEHRAARQPVLPAGLVPAWSRRYGDTGLLAARPAAGR